MTESFHLIFACDNEWDLGILKRVVVPSHYLSIYMYKPQTRTESYSGVRDFQWTAICVLSRSEIYCKSHIVHFYDIFWCFLRRKGSGNHFLLQYGKEQQEHYSKFLLLCSTEETKIMKQSERHGDEQIMTVDFFFKFWTMTLNEYRIWRLPWRGVRLKYLESL